MLAPRVLLQAHFPTRQKLVADMFEWPTPGRLALLVCLIFANFGIVQFVHIRDQLLVGGAAVLPLLLLVRILQRDAPFRPPVVPHVA